MNYTKEDQIIPIVEGYREGEFMKVNCPYCGQLHRHGYNVKAYPSHRVAHCHLNKASPGYLVTERFCCVSKIPLSPKERQSPMPDFTDKFKQLEGGKYGEAT